MQMKQYMYFKQKEAPKLVDLFTHTLAATSH